MNYYMIHYPNHVKLIVKDERDLLPALKVFQSSSGISWHGTIYNSQSFLTFSKLYEAEESTKALAQPFHSNLVWK